MLTGVYGRAIPSALEPLAQQLLELSSTYMPTELRALLPKLRDELTLSNLRVPISHADAGAVAQPIAAYDPAMEYWTLHDVWQHQLARDRGDTSSKGGQANHGGTLEERDRRARVMTVLTRHKPVTQLSKQEWQAAYDAARKVRNNVKASVAPNPTPLEELLTDDPAQMTGHERVSALIASMKQLQNYSRHLDLTSIRVDDLLLSRCKNERQNVVETACLFRQRTLSPFFLDSFIKATFLPIKQKHTPTGFGFRR